MFRGFSFVKIFLTKLSCYHDNYFKYFMFGKYNGFVSKVRGFCIHVFSSRLLLDSYLLLILENRIITIINRIITVI
jgi:hypothetical protein